MWVAIPAQSFDLRFVPPACIRVSGTTISDLQNSRDSPNTSNCGIPKICWSCGGGHEHIGMAASHGTVQFRSNLPSKGFWARGLSRCSGAGVGQPVKSRTYRAGGGWVGGSAYSHKATSQTSLNQSPQHQARPLIPPSPMRGPDRLCVAYHNPSDK